jgi:tetratricopeptide (TPR) repeat protein
MGVIMFGPYQLFAAGKGNETLAAWHLEQAIQLMRKNDNSYVDSGKTHLTMAISLGKGTIAEVKAKRFLEHNWPKRPVPKSIVKKHNEALAIESTPEAERLWRQCIKACPSYEHPYTGLGYKLFKEGRRKEAESLFKAVMKRNPQYVRPYLRMVGIEYGRGDYKRADEYLAKAIHMNPFDWKVAYYVRETKLPGFSENHFHLILEKELDAARREASARGKRG